MQKYRVRKALQISSFIIAAMFISAVNNGWGAELLPFPGEQKQSQPMSKTQYSQEFRDEISSLSCKDLRTLKDQLKDDRAETGDPQENEYYSGLVRIVGEVEKQKNCK